MTFFLFRQLSYERQLHYVLTQSQYVTFRFEARVPILLYHLADGGRGFFVELGVDEAQTYFFVRRSFEEATLLEQYLHP